MEHIKTKADKIILKKTNAKLWSYKSLFANSTSTGSL